jgi:hypothetical protein
MQDRNLWDVSIAPTIVMTQQGVRSDMQVSFNLLPTNCYSFQTLLFLLLFASFDFNLPHS